MLRALAAATVGCLLGFLLSYVVFVNVLDTGGGWLAFVPPMAGAALGFWRWS